MKINQQDVASVRAVKLMDELLAIDAHPAHCRTHSGARVAGHRELSTVPLKFSRQR